MANEQSRITVIGAHRRVDVAVPSISPIGEYAPRLAEICEESGPDAMPPVWSLGVAGEPAFPADASLADLGVVDGQVLYLRDIAVEPGDAPVVKDIDEVVADESLRRRRDRMHAGPVVLAFGLAWLIAAAVVIGSRSAGSAASTAGLVLVSLAILATGYGLRHRSSAVPAALVHIVVISSIPCMAVAGVLVAQGFGGPGLRWAGGVAGANVGGLMALAAMPGVVLMAIELQLAVAAVLVLVIMGLGADQVAASALVAAVAMGLIAVSRQVSASLMAWSNRVPTGRRAAALATGDLVIRSGRLLAVVIAGPTVALAVTLPTLALSPRAFAVATATVITIALLARARLAAFTSELLTQGGAGLIGTFALLVHLAELVDITGAAAEALLLGASITIIGLGVAMSVLLQTPEEPEPDGVPRPKKPRKRSKAEAIGVITAVATVPLTMGVFGVFGHLVWVGRTLF
ncbi:EsaB/YukD family protein [Actinoplanes sp. NPDC049265]|uniref:EsaB/YukD family protein n=1 Tax=Actinoplanes sp. NPDC049265 TaxID=3363902 RepID=UPI0037132614